MSRGRNACAVRILAFVRTADTEGVRTVLVVDDDALITSVIARILQARGMNVVQASSAEAAMAVIDGQSVHLVISDVHMPGLRGPELLAHLRARGVDAPVVFISGDLGVDTLDQSLSIPNAAFLPKPFTADELVATVSENLR
jgi:two-component system cell cycle sensor histidine kinase/response regulator CckA